MLTVTRADKIQPSFYQAKVNKTGVHFGSLAYESDNLTSPEFKQSDNQRCTVISFYTVFQIFMKSLAAFIKFIFSAHSNLTGLSL